MLTPDALRTITLFADLDADTLHWLAEHAEVASLDTGDTLIDAGAEAEWMLFNLEGRLRTTVRQDNNAASTFTFEAGTVAGFLPRSRMTHFPAAIRAIEPSRVGLLHRRHFTEMHRRFPVLDERLAHLMLDRTRAGARARLHQDKLASLGTMAAGLAHELNNPASAARRAAQNLHETLERFDAHAGLMLRLVMFKTVSDDRDPFQPIKDLLGGERPHLDPLTVGEREDELADWLEERGTEAPWDAAAALVSVGFTQAFLADFSEALVENHVVDFLNWLHRDIEMILLAEELSESTLRISDLVSAMKSYSYMDQANEKADTDLHKGLDDTLQILNHKRKKKSVEIVRDYADLPSVPAFGGELNQVWTNILDNALAAVPETGGRIRIETCFDATSQSASVEIIDNGSGIPAEIQERIFEPFFTTKPSGEGTGLGLDIAYRIVTDRHGGTIEVASQPGETRFLVRLPASETGEPVPHP